MAMPIEPAFIFLFIPFIFFIASLPIFYMGWGGREAVVAIMTEGSADDAAARDRFVWAVDQLPEDAVLAHNDEDDDDLALWVALGPIREEDGSSSAADERQLAERRGEDVLSAVLMDRIPHVGRLRGPDFHAADCDVDGGGWWRYHGWETRRKHRYRRCDGTNRSHREPH